MRRRWTLNKQSEFFAIISPTQCQTFSAHLSGSSNTGTGSWPEITGKPFERVGDGLKVESGTLKVDVANDAEKDNTRPISSAAVYTEIGNIDILLQTI